MSIPQTDSTGTRILAALEPFQLKAEGAGQWRCNSPLRPGSDSHSFRLKIEPDGEHGAYFDFRSEESGSLYELATALGIPLPERTLVPDSKRVYGSLDDYAAAHGIPSSVLTEAGWQAVSRDSRPALEFTTRTGKRWRFLDGAKPTYKSRVGYQRCWYGLDGAVALARETEQPLVLCNGEVSTLVGQYHGVAACCITGGEKAQIPPDLLEALKAVWQGPLLVAFDCLDKGSQAAPQVATQLQSFGLRAKAIDLRLSKGGDLADFCRLHGRGAVRALQTLPLLQEPQRAVYKRERPILHQSELKHLPPTTWLVEGEITSRGLTILFGPPGAGKSFVALDYAMRLSEQVPVLYVAAEGEAGLGKRSEAWLQHHQKAAGQLYFHLGAVWTWDSQDVQDFIERIRPLQPRVVIIDTLIRCIAGSDSDPREMNAFLRACDEIQHAIDGQVIVIHHTGWSTTQRERGWSGARGNADTVIRVTQDDGLIQIESIKTKDENPFPARYMRLLPVVTPYGESRVLVPTDKIVQTKDDPPTPNQLKVLETLAMAVFESGATKQEIMEVTEVPVGSLARILSRFIQLGWVQSNNSQRTHTFSLTPDGQAAYQRWSPQAPKDQAFTQPDHVKPESTPGSDRSDPRSDRSSDRSASSPTGTEQTAEVIGQIGPESDSPENQILQKEEIRPIRPIRSDAERINGGDQTTDQIGPPGDQNARSDDQIQPSLFPRRTPNHYDEGL